MISDEQIGYELMGIKLFGKNLYQFYKHHIMCLDYKDDVTSSNLTLCKIDLNHIAEEINPIGTTVTIRNLTRLVRKNAGKCEGFKFIKEEESIGTIWVMYRGSDDLEYRIRNFDAYIFDVFVNEAHRGHGYAGEMIHQLMNYLHERGIDTACLAVSASNESAVKAYSKAGFRLIKDLRFARILKVNIPYHIL